MASEDGDFWDRRYQREGPIWGWEPSPTALAAQARLAAGSTVLDVGFGYGRDIAFYLRHDLNAAGIDMSAAGRRLALELLTRQGLQPSTLWTGRFEDMALSTAGFDAVCCHRMIHLLLDEAAVHRFVERVARVLRPGGLLCVAARNLHDLDRSAMTELQGTVFEYRNRPGHRIRYWDEDAFRHAFGPRFEILALTEASEAESQQRPVPCRLTVLVARLHGRP
jgi:SAM-dependent methyltransferase